MEWQMSEEEYIEKCRRGFYTGKARGDAVRYFSRKVMDECDRLTSNRAESYRLHTAILTVIKLAFEKRGIAQLEYEDIPEAGDIAESVIGIIEKRREKVA